MVTKKASSTMMAAEVFSRKALSGLSAQRNIWTGSTVARIGESAGDIHDKGHHADHQARGAVSPRAWAMPMMVPVSMPGMARGRT